MAASIKQTLEGRVQVEPERVHSESGVNLDIAVGEKLMLEIVCPTARFWTEFLGMRREEYLILAMPSKAELRECLFAEQAVTARYLHRGYHVCGFQTYVVGSVKKPYPMFFLAFPLRIEVINLRHDERVTCFLQSSIFIDGQEHAGFMTNLSVSGARFAVEAGPGSSPPKLSADAEAFCLFKMTGSDEELYIRGLVKSPTRSGRFLEFGFRFEELDDKARLSIQSYVELVKRYHGADKKN